MKKLKRKLMKFNEKIKHNILINNGYDFFTITVNGKVTDIQFYKM